MHAFTRPARRSTSVCNRRCGLAAFAIGSLIACGGDPGNALKAGSSGGSSPELTAVSFVQVAYATPQTNSASVTVKYASAQAAGNLNVIAVGWNDTTATVTSLADTKGNIYVRAVGPTTYPGTLTQSLYYAKNIAAAAAGTNSVTVKFSVAAVWVDVRILEYAGLDTAAPLDATAAASGSTATSDSGPLTTTGPNELLFAANLTTGLTSGPGTGFTKRVITSPDSDIAEDRVVATAGTYRGTAPTSGQWVMQMAAFRSAPVQPDTTPPTVPANLAATAASSSQINLSWTASTDAVGVTGYLLERCQDAGCATFAQIATPAGTSYSDTGLLASTSYTYRVRARDAAGNLSGYSTPSSATTPAAALPPTPPANLVATASSTSQINLTWTASTSSAGVGSYLVERCQGAGCTTFAQIAAPTAASYSDTGLLAATTYTYRVRATDAAGNLSGYSNAASDTTLTPPPSSVVKFVQVAYATPQADSASVTVTYAAAQAAGNLNVIAVGWNDTTAAVTSLTDTKGNVYVRAVGPTTYPGALTQSLYYAKSIAAAAAGTNSVTVKFNVAAAFVDLRILEYAGLDTVAPLDATAAAAGSTATNDSGPLTTTSPNELLFAANMTTGTTSGAGTGFTSRVVTSPDADIAEDRIATTAGTYRGTAQASGLWVMQMAAFRAGLSFGVSPRVATFTTTRTQQFTATSAAVWSVNGIAGGSAAAGTITASGLYTPPANVGSYTVTATSTGSLAATASATAYVTSYPGTFTYHNDNLRTGANLNETVLTPANVQAQFGLLFDFALDGVPQASPLYVANVNIPGVGLRNVVYVATEHDSVYAIDADTASSTPLWKVSFINPAAGVTTVPACDTGECQDISPEIGITGTPVIDPATSSLYVVAKTKETSGTTTSYVHRLHALDIATGAEKLGGPVVIQAQVRGTGDGTDGLGHISLNAIRENQRPALALTNGIVYVAFASHGDISPWHGWLLGHDASTLAQVFAFNDTPNGGGGGFWQAGSGPGADASGNVFLIAGNGSFTGSAGGVDFGDSFLKLSPAGALLDWFTPFNQATFGNVELGSGGNLLLPDQPGPHPHLLLGAGKTGTLYVLDRDNLGHFNPGNDGQIVQSLINVFPNGYPESYWTAPVVFQDLVYFGPNTDTVQAFRLTNGLLSTAPVSRTSLIYNFPGAMMAVSANGTSNGILWCGERPAAGPGVLHAYDARDLTRQLYSGVLPDALTKFTIPTVANGKVYVGALSRLAVFGLVP